MTLHQHSKLDEEEVLLAYSAEPTHDHTTLEHYLREYPDHAQALVACSIELMVGETHSSEIAEVSDEVVERAWQRFQSAVSLPQGESVANPFATLNPAAFKSLAKKLDINNLLLIRLRDRTIDTTTIPLRFVQKLATALDATSEVMMSYLSNPPAMVSEQSFRSSKKPAVTEQISFTKAVETSQLTQAQQDALKALQD